MRDEAGNYRDDGNVRPFRETEHFLKFGFADGFAAHIAHRVVFKKSFIRFGVVNFLAYAVQNTYYLARVVVNRVLKSVRKIFVFNLFRISFRNRSDVIGKLNRTLHEVQAPVVIERGFDVIGKPEQIFQNFLAVLSLILYIMNSENRSDMVEAPTVSVYGFKVYNGERGLPIVAMHDVRIPIHILHSFKHRAREESKPFAVVVVTVKSRATEVIFVVDEKICYALSLIREKPAILISPTDGNVEVADIRKVIPVPLVHCSVKGQNNSDVVVAAFGNG